MAKRRSKVWSAAAEVKFWPWTMVSDG
uniref:Uncharacterized protein n=1 Tax=Arundo donax TaxID=35708 RepID=A0A0A9AV43_ARUDO